MEVRSFLKWECCEPRLQREQTQRLIGRLHVELQIPPRSPDERNEIGRVRTVGQKVVGYSLDVLTLDLIAIPLLALLIDQGLGIGEPNRGTESTRHRELRICRRK